MQRPDSAVSDATGIVGAISLTILIIIIKATEFPILAATFLLLVGTALPMIVWTLLVEKAHLRKSTGLDFSIRHSSSDLLSLTRTKLIGLGATFLLIALSYFIFKHYEDDRFVFHFAVVYAALPIIVLIAPFYIWFVSCHMVDPRDGLWHFGRLVCFDFSSVDSEKVKDHLRCWTIKGFFLAFMMSIFPGLAVSVLKFDVYNDISNPVDVILFFVTITFLFDVCFGTIGYILTCRPLDTHICSANPYLAAWVATLVCYPPFSVMITDGPLDYRTGTQEWHLWFAGQDALLLAWGLAILGLAFIYAWATVIFGLRFSNLTHRGIVTNGPYRYFKHPAYLSKNAMWWLVHLPFLSMTSPSEALRNSLLLLVVNVIYYFRAKTEEKHLLTDPRYQAYSEWIMQNGVLERLFSGSMRRWRKHRLTRTLTATRKTDF